MSSPRNNPTRDDRVHAARQQPSGGAVARRQCGTPVNRPTVVVAAKSSGVAALLSLLWLGAGHLYAGRIAAGVILVVFDSLLMLLSLSGIGLVLTIPVWLIACPLTMWLSARAANQFNARNGIFVR